MGPGCFLIFLVLIIVHTIHSLLAAKSGLYAQLVKGFVEAQAQSLRAYARFGGRS